MKIALEKGVSDPNGTGNETGNTLVTPRVRVHDLLQRPFDVRSFALTGLFLLAIFYTVYFLRSLLLPLVLALLLSYLLRPIVRGLAEMRIPPSIGSALLLLSLIGAAGYSFSFLAAPAAGWIEKAPYSLQQLQRRLTAFKKPMAKVAQASGAIEDLTTPEAAAKQTPTVEVKQHPISEQLYAHTSELLVSTLTMVILHYFLIVPHGVFLAKLIKQCLHSQIRTRGLHRARNRGSNLALPFHDDDDQCRPWDRGWGGSWFVRLAQPGHVGRARRGAQFHPLSRSV